MEYEKDISLVEYATVEDAIHSIINFDNPNLKGISMENLEFYLASKKGKPKDDFPAIEKS